MGLGYIKLGQSATTLSGGEAQRVKLALELAKRETGQTVYILDEPTTGLHMADVHKLVKVLDKLVEGGNTVIVIEHNLDVIKRADHIIDLGPEGGVNGGLIVAQGTPEQVAENPASFTGQFLKPLLARRRQSARRREKGKSRTLKPGAPDAAGSKTGRKLRASVRFPACFYSYCNTTITRENSFSCQS